MTHSCHSLEAHPPDSAMLSARCRNFSESMADPDTSGTERMERGRARQLFHKYAAAMAYVVVVRPDGTEAIGSAFHIGEGVFVTARHVVEGLELREVRPSEPVGIPTKDFLPEAPTDYDEAVREVIGHTPLWKHYQAPLELACEPVFHRDPRIDIAAFSVKGLHPTTSAVPLGSHLDDWIRNEDWMLSEAVVLGYPPIPYTLQPELVAVRAEVNAVVVPRDAPKVHFIISAIPRGGFSGGLVLSEYGFALGVVSRSLLRDRHSEELGFFSVLSVEPIFECLSSNRLLPEAQREGWDDFWNTTTTVFLERGSKGSGKQVAYVSCHNDGKRLYVDLWAEEQPLLTAALAAARAMLPAGKYHDERGKGASVRLMMHDANPTVELTLKQACEAAHEVLSGSGLYKLATLGEN